MRNVQEGGLTVGRRSKKFGYLALGMFVIVFVFSFLAQRMNTNNEVEAASLAGFDPGYIISDYQMGNYNSMSESDIQAFLTRKNSCSNSDYSYYLRLSANTKYKWHWSDGHFVCLSEERFGDGEVIGSGDTAAHIIWRAAQDYRINPQVLLVLLQKETGLITDPIPNDGDYRKATGYGCPDTAPCSSQYYGFKNQIRKAAALFRTVLDGGWTNYPLGNNYIQYNPNAGCGGSVVNIRSLATSALYRYTPYQPNEGALAAGYGMAYCGAYGNRNFYLYFQDWFGGITTSGSISAPRNIKATQNDKAITITWDEPSNLGLFGEASYEIVLADDSRKELKVTVDGDKREYTFSNLAEGTYIATSVRVVTKSSSNFGRTTFNYAVGRLPEAPTDLRVEKAKGGIQVAWKKPKDTGGLKVLKYEIVIASTDKQEYKMEVDGNQDSAVFYGLPLKNYFAASVKTINAKGGRHARVVFDVCNYAVLSEDVDTYTGFLDMPGDEISKKAVSWAVYNKITDSNQYFNGEQALTRRQAM
ncbi:fibronectin type III domain-containing protein, partial [Candidatus Saccharibacteria bacterium]|nr:fibronectin type III domain-containing protein [Candidatus Saccharibacteria bacterium]